jgi:RNA polymerase sigma-70 factor (ECF subfamily)
MFSPRARFWDAHPQNRAVPYGGTAAPTPIVLIIQALYSERVAFRLPSPYGGGDMASATIAANNYDISLFKRARLGDSDAFTTLAATCESAVFRVALRITGNTHDAEDVRQQTFLKAFSHFDQFRDGYRFAAWITQIAANESISLLRRRRDSRWRSLDEMMSEHESGRAPLEPRSVRENPEQFYSRLELRRRLIEALAQLDPSLRCVCLLRDVGNLSTEETAEQLGLTPQAVRTRLFRGRLKLRERLRGFFFQRTRTSNRAPLPQAACGD